MGGSDSEESAVAAGVRWASRVSTVGLEFALPPFAGLYLDRLWNLSPILTIAGGLLGFAVGMAHLLQIAREEAARGKKPR